jgi:hypothetical protein
MHVSRRLLPLAAAAAVGFFATAASAHHGQLDPLPGQHGFVGQHRAPFVAPRGSISGTWTPLAHAFPGTNFPDTAVLLTDGSVMMHDGCSTDWYRLLPDKNGSYLNGTWKKTGSMPAGYTPLYFASQVLPDGRLIVNGGEYIDCNPVWSTLGALYDPVKDKWTAVLPPTGWTAIGDAQSVVRTDGSYMLADCCTPAEAIASIKGTKVTWTATGTGKGDRNDEEGWTQLPDQTIVTVDASRGLSLPTNITERYSEADGTWTLGKNTANRVVDPGSSEVGPALLLPNGLVFQIGATGHNDVFDPVKGKWFAAPDFPNLGDGTVDAADGPAAVLPDGNVLAQVSPGVFNAPSHFLEIAVKNTKTVTVTQVSEPASAADQSSYEGRMLVLPTGEVLWSSDVGDVEIYASQGKAKKAWLPVITSVASSLSLGSTKNALSGTNLNGLSYGGYYGDDAQMSTNFPIVRITNNATQHVCYAKTHDHTAMGISTGAVTGTQFDIPSTCESGASTLQVVASGLASKGTPVTLN